MSGEEGVGRKSGALSRWLSGPASLQAHATPRRHATTVATALGTLALTAALAEVGIRAWNPEPRVAVVRADTPRLRLIDDGPVLRWQELPVPRTAADDCVDGGRPIVLVAGDSVLVAHSSNDPARRFDAQLQARLRADLPGACVHDLSQSGYAPEQQFAEAKIGAQTWHPDVLVFLVWKPEGRLERHGDTWYDFTRLQRGADGLPTPFGAPVPAALNRALLDHSRLWAYALTATAPSTFPSDPGATYLRVADWAAAQDLPVLFVGAAPMDMPFDAPRHDVYASWPGQVLDALRARNLPVVSIREAWVGHRPEDVRLDTCCHLNDAGHALLAQTVEGPVRALLAGRAAAP